MLFETSHFEYRFEHSKSDGVVIITETGYPVGIFEFNFALVTPTDCDVARFHVSPAVKSHLRAVVTLLYSE